MVALGNFSVRLVNAETKEPFKEHGGPDGKIYAEVEPGLDYFIETEVVGGDDPEKRFLIRIFVDGKKLSYRSSQSKSGGKRYRGIWSVENRVQKSQALSFQKPTLVGGASSAGSNSLFGVVKVEILETISRCTKKRVDHSPSSMDVAAIDSDATGLSPGQTKQAVRSGKGHNIETRQLEETYTSYMPGKLLQTFTIHYCTVWGLINEGVLQKPDYWEAARMKHPCKRPANQNIPVQPKRFKREGFVAGGVTMVAPKEFELFDLTTTAEEVPSED
ncbi:expressed unknown protein [Seminavis robusta]|uniref:Uncharacterized protein n=1 Tax=Seminavis robusta TaxID=568900 RepID=A0A9N8EM49_9STRA|nr:expressed unknown protein [Seminavis robusta]|eukprot:Sro1451_g273860.1 n/a (274) ;mRNA; r:18185-19006